MDFSQVRGVKYIVDQKSNPFTNDFDLFDDLVVPAIIIRGQNILLNKAAEELTGYLRTEIRDVDDWFKKLYREHAHLAKIFYREDIANRTLKNREVILTTKSGEKREVRFSGHLDGDTEFWLMNDTTDLNRSKFERNRFAYLVESTPDIVGFVDFVNQKTYMNHAGLQMYKSLGYQEAVNFFINDGPRITHENFLEILSLAHPLWAFTTIVREGLPKAYREGMWQGESAIWVKVDGQNRDEQAVLQTIFIQKSRTGDLESVSLILRDVSALKEQQRKMFEQSENVKKIMDSVSVAIFRTDVEGKCTFVNLEWTRISGLGFNSSVGTKWLSALHAQDHQRIKVLFENLKTATFPVATEFRVVKPPATERTVDMHITMEQGSEGELLGFLATIQDQTEIKKAQKELEIEKMKSVQAAKMAALGEMAGGIAHEINNPLAIILGRINLIKQAMLRDELTPEKLLTFVDKLEVTSSRISKIVSGLRHFSRSGEHDPFYNTAIKSVVLDTLEICSERFRLSTVPIEVGDLENLFVRCRSVQISQVLLNLLNNSLDAVSELPEKWVKISARLADSDVYLSVEDSGTGISESIQEKIMEPFFTTKKVGKGTGLGLSISRGILQEHGGDLILDKTSKNTRFVIKLPAEELPHFELAKELETLSPAPR